LTLQNHIVLMFLYALAAGLFFSILWRRSRQARIKFFLLVFLSLFFGGIILGWAMYPWPK